MNLFDRYTDLPFDDKKEYIDRLIDYRDYVDIFSQFDLLFDKVNSQIDIDFFKEKYCYQQKVFKLVETNTIVFNLLIKTLELQKIIDLNSNEKIILNCTSEELDYINYGVSGTYANRFANFYAWLAEEIPEYFDIVATYKKKEKVEINTSSNNLLLKYINYKPRMLLSNLLKKYNMISFNKEKILIIMENETIKEIESELNLDNIKAINVRKELDKLYYENIYKEQLSGQYHSKIYTILEDNLMIYLRDKLFISEKLSIAYINVLTKLISYQIEYLELIKDFLRIKIKEVLDNYETKCILTNGLFGPYGIAVSDALLFNNATIISTEHGLTAGNSKDYNFFLSHSEGRTSNIVFAYNEASSLLRKSIKNNANKIVNIGVPTNTKKINFQFLQNYINRKKFNLKVHEKIIFYVSHNIMLNVPKYYPYTKSNSFIYEDEQNLLTNVLNKVNKKVLYKDYPTKQYINQKDVSLKNLHNIIKVDSHEDFRYMRSLSDIVITQGSESTLGWCIGINKPLIFLNSEYYEPLLNDDVKKAFEESFFVFNYDIDGWEKELITFLNKPYKEIMKLWNDKEIYRKKYDDIYFLSMKKDTGKLGSNFIKKLIIDTL
ncbi:hypothetical protein [Sulfurimonas sp.]